MTAMAQENDHIRKLIAARDREVEQRRNLKGEQRAVLTSHYGFPYLRHAAMPRAF